MNFRHVIQRLGRASVRLGGKGIPVKGTGTNVSSTAYVLQKKTLFAQIPLDHTIVTAKEVLNQIMESVLRKKKVSEDAIELRAANKK